MLKHTVDNSLSDECFNRRGLASVLRAVPVTRTLRVIVLRLTELLTATQHTATALMGFSRTCSIREKERATREYLRKLLHHVSYVSHIKYDFQIIVQVESNANR